MRKSILAVCMFILLCLLSCDINALNDLLGKVGEKFLGENKNDKDHRQGNQEEKEQEDVISNVKEREIQQDIEVEPIVPVNAGISVSQQGYPYYIQEEEIEIKEEDLAPSTEYEKDAQAEIENVKRALEDSKFDQLIENSRKLQVESKQLESDFYRIFSELQTKLQEQRSLPKINSQTDRTKIQELIKLQNRFNEKRTQIDMFMTQVDAGFNERSSAKYFFEESEKTLKGAISERLRNKRRSYSSRRGNSDLLAKKAQSEVENSLSLLESSSGKIGEAMGIKKDIEELIKEAKSYLSSLAR
ncbi:P12 family lipoprotein [Borrelia hermsii]|nr:P12 family lipoprotein [Borrelia hermsii]